MAQLPNPINPGDSIRAWTKQVCDYLRAITPRPSPQILPRIGNGTTYELISQRSVSADPIPAPFEVLAGTSPGTLKVNYNSKLFKDFIHPDAGADAIITISGLSTPDPGVSDGIGGTMPTPGYVDPGEFTPDSRGSIWLWYYITEDGGGGGYGGYGGGGGGDATTTEHAEIDFTYPGGELWEGYPKMILLTGAPVMQTGAFYLVADLVDPSAPEPGKIVTVGVGDSAERAKIVQYARNHLIMGNRSYNDVPVRFPIPLF